MVQIPGFISLGLMTAIIFLISSNRKKIKEKHTNFMMYCIAIFCYELALLITWSLHVENHLIANINSVIYLPLAFFLISQIYLGFYKLNKTIRVVQTIIIVATIIVWIVENFLAGSIFTYNSRLPGFASILLTLACIYLVNILIFTKSEQFLKDPDVLIVIGLLIRSITFGFTLWFLNFDYDFDKEFYSNLLVGINIGLCISDLFFLYAVQRILIPPNNNIKVKREK